LTLFSNYRTASNPFSWIGLIFRAMFADCIRISDAIYDSFWVPNILGDWFRSAGDWFWDAWAWFDKAASWYEGVVTAISGIITAFDISDIISDFVRTLGAIWSWISDWWTNVASVIGTWWTAVSDTVLDWIATAVDVFGDVVDTVQTAINALSTAWSTFTTETLPELLSLDWVRGFWGLGIDQISDWWTPTHTAVSEETEVVVKPVRDQVNEHSNWFDLIKDLINKPAEWLLAMIERMVVELW